MKKKLSLAFIILICIIGILALISLIGYSYSNKSGHTSIDPYIALLIFIPVALFGLIQLFISLKTKTIRWLAIVAIVIGLIGILVLIYLDKSNTLLQYEVWIKRGIP